MLGLQNPTQTLFKTLRKQKFLFTSVWPTVQIMSIDSWVSNEQLYYPFFLVTNWPRHNIYIEYLLTFALYGRSGLNLSGPSRTSLISNCWNYKLWPVVFKQVPEIIHKHLYYTNVNMVSTMYSITYCRSTYLSLVLALVSSLTPYWNVEYLS